ncbi:MAG TPA: lysophospholipid acyltransferase family protein [Gammaproteobacteria bacterium]|nr:lysophospholipid acyltransferase family protein [Gammaproteobacteria bacterium]
MSNLLRDIIFTLFFRPLVWVVLGLNVKYRNRLPMKGPAILVANHNSHLDTIVLMSLYPRESVSQVRPVAAADYFLKNRYLKWFCQCILQIIPIHRVFKKNKFHDPLHKISAALRQGAIVIYYPEGTRGEPEKMGKFKKGIMHLAKRHPKVPIVPVYLEGLGKVLPKGEKLLVPFNVKAVIGNPMPRLENKNDFINSLREQISSLAKEFYYV